MIGRYLILVGERREGWEAILVRLAGLSGLQVAHNQFPLAVLRGGSCGCHALEEGVLVGTLFERHGPPKPICSLERSDAEAIVASHGDALLRSFWGGYVGAMRQGEGFRLLRDPSGALPCYFARGPDLWAFASGADLLADCGLVRPAVNWAALGRDLFAAGLPRPETVLEGVGELMPGFSMHVPGGGQQEMIWNPWDHVATTGRFDDRERADHLARVVRQVVQGWASGGQGIVLGLSGGLDSSIVAASLRGASAKITCVTLFTTDPAGDERPYARIVCRALGLPLVEMPYDVARVNIACPFAPQLPRPVGRIQAQAYDGALVELAGTLSADAFMTGNGGDNVFAYSQSAGAIADRWLVEGPGRGLLRTLVDTCRQTGCGMGQAIGSAVRLQRRGRSYAWRPDPRLLSRDVLAELSTMSLSHPWLEAPEGGLPGKAAHIAGLLRAQHTLEPGRSRFAPVHHPLLSQPVVEACLAVPSWEWRKGGVDRAFARRAFGNLLPPAILRRRVKGTPDPFSSAVLNAYRPSIRDRLVGGHMARHGLVDGKAIGRALEEDPRRPAEDNLRILQLVAAEAWLDHWLARAAPG